MLNLKNGVIKIQTGRGIIDTINDISLILLLVCMTTLGGAAEGSNYIYYFAFFAFFFLSLINIFAETINNHKILISIHSIWYLIFIVFGIVSSIWAYDFNAVFNPIEPMIQILVITFCIQVYVKDEADFERLLDLLLLTAAIMSVYILIKTPIESWTGGFFGYITGYNTNSVGIFLATCVMISAYKGLVLGKRAYLFLTGAFLLFVILTSSRKSLFISILGVISIVTFNIKKRNYALRVILVIGLVGILMFAIFNVPYLYKAVGYRLATMAEYFTEDASADSSLSLRSYFIQMGTQFYLEHPVLGIGLNNFAQYLSQYSTISLYAHNNYVELASCIGTVGLIIYYWFYIYLLFKLFRQMMRGQRLALLFFPLICLIIVFEYSMVTYYSTMIQTMIVISYLAVCINDEKTLKKIND